MILYENDVDRLDKIKDYIDSNLNQDLKIKTIAQKFSLEQHTLRRHFKAHFHLSLHLYVRNKRMAKAYELLSKQAMPVSEVADATGYSDVSTFSHAFSAYHGIAPNNCLKKRFQKRIDNEIVIDCNVL